MSASKPIARLEGFTEAFTEVYDGNVDLDVMGTPHGQLGRGATSMSMRQPPASSEYFRKPPANHVQEQATQTEAYRLAILAEKTATVLGQQETLLV